VRARAFALAAFFVVVQFYTSLATLSPTPPVGYLFATRAVATAMVAVLVLAAAYLLVELWRERRAPTPASRTLLVAWIGSAALSGMLGLDPLSSLQVVGVMLVCAIFHVALVRFYPAANVARTVLGAYLVTGLVAALAALAMLALREPAALYAFNHGRAAGFFVTANQFASFLVVFIFVALGVALAARGPWRVLGVTSAAASVAALAATVSLGGWIGAAAGGTFFAFASGARRAAAAFACAAVLVALVVAARPAARHNPAEALDRVRIWHAGLRVAELFPLTGVGPMAYWRVYPAIRPPDGDPPGTFGALHPHDVYLSLAGETGVVGLLAAGYGWFRFAAAVRAALRGRSAGERHVALGVCAGLVAMLAQGVFDTIGIVEMTFVWIPFTALALAAAEAGFPGRGLGAVGRPKELTA